MKATFFIFFLTIAITGTAQDTSNHLLDGIVPYENLSVRYKGVVELPGISATEIYNRAKKWIAQTYNSSNAVIQLDNQAAGELLARGNTILDFSQSSLYSNIWRAKHDIFIQIKDNKYRYELTVPFIVTTSPMTDEYKPTYYLRHLSPKKGRALLTALDNSCRFLINSLNAALNQSVTNNW